MGNHGRRWFSAAFAGLLLLTCSCGCACKPRAALLSGARQYIDGLSMQDCEYRIYRISDSILIQRHRDWSSANLPEYPGGTIFFDGKKTYFCRDSAGFSITEAERGVLASDPNAEELPGFSLAAYDCMAEQLQKILREAMTRPDWLKARYNTAHITANDYLYFDFTEAFLADDGLQDAIGQYDGGFLAFYYSGKGGRVNACGAVFYRYAADGKTELRDYYDYMDPDANNGYVLFRGDQAKARNADDGK